jgi:1-aminocyclopropane-1-carboxylate deaminase/D-cysteine desulfhydrase-like pyridoxal-dependent ACC family enzyme
LVTVAGCVHVGARGRRSRKISHDHNGRRRNGTTPTITANTKPAAPLGYPSIVQPMAPQAKTLAAIADLVVVLIVPAGSA